MGEVKDLDLVDDPPMGKRGVDIGEATDERKNLNVGPVRSPKGRGLKVKTGFVRPIVKKRCSWAKEKDSLGVRKTTSVKN